MLHIALGLATVGIGLFGLTGQLALSRLTKGMGGLFAGTWLSGGLLMLTTPGVVTHVCVSGAVFSVLAIALYVVAQNRLQHGAISPLQ